MTQKPKPKTYLPLIALGLFTPATVCFLAITWIESVFLHTWTGSAMVASFPEVIQNTLLFNSLLMIIIMPLAEFTGIVLGLLAIPLHLMKNRGRALLGVAFGLQILVWLDGLVTWLCLAFGKALSG